MHERVEDEPVPHERPEVKERFRRHMAAQAKKRKAEEMI